MKTEGAAEDDEAVNEAFNQWMHSRRAGVKQMAVTIDPTHAQILPMTNGSIADHYKNKTSMFVYLSAGGADTGVKHAVLIPAIEKKRTHLNQRRRQQQQQQHIPFCTIYLQNVLKFCMYSASFRRFSR